MLRKVDKIAKITATILLVVMMLAMVSTSVFAEWGVSITANTSAQGTGTVTNIGGSVVGIVQVVGVVMLVIIGIKYITSSPEGKAEVKKTALYYVLGAALIAGAVTVAGVIFDFGSDISVS